ncbi:MAG TPA: polysaccharide biosynthesis protein [Mobilitalea sp.]|nr:polysaccharide biosynthesis protein [Mobilitalea sp.]
MSDRSKSSHFLVQGSILAVASILVRVIGLIYRIPMQRIIGQEGTGLYSYSFEVYNIALILSSYSLPLAVSRLVAVRRVNKEHRNSYRIFLCAMALAIGVGSVATLVIFFGADFLATSLFKSPNTALPLRVLSPTIFIFSIMGVLRGFYQGKNTTIPTALSQVLEQLVNAVVSILAAYLFVKNFSASVNVAAWGASGGTLGTFAGACIALIFLLFVFALYKPVINKQVRHDHSDHLESYGSIFKLLIITILPIILSQTVYQISGLLDGTLFGHIMSSKIITTFDNEVLKVLPSQLYTDSNRDTLWGIYSGEYRLLTNVPVAVATAMGAAIVTSISADMARGMEAAIKSKVHSAIKFNMIIAIPSAVGMSVLAAPIISLIFDDQYHLSANIMMLGSISIVFYALSTISTAILQGINKLRIPVIHSAISLGIHIILVFGLLQFTHLSTYALVIGNVTFPLVVSILNWLSIEKYLKYQQEVIKTFVIPFVSAGLMGIVAFFTYYGMDKLTGSNLLSTVLAVFIAIIVYFLLLVFLRGLSEEELAFVPKGTVIVRVMKKMHLL